MTDAEWETLPVQDRAVQEIGYFGNGKDADLVITFADGSTGTVPSRHVSITSSTTMQLTISSLDDLNLAVRITGEGLAIAAGRVANYAADDELYGPRFRDDLAQWTMPGRHSVGTVTPVELELRTVSD
ncbi:hypothetical protein [Nocardia tenerifensis]|uniref:hypothetical protein n=1 Tax=Nocardia tenerifensis TaxID=228006 RepID=UPI000594094A|nr:hypothetical protein [Nocardia tenerifensis]